MKRLIPARRRLHLHSVIATSEGGKAYLNVRTPKNPGGEIRGQVKVSG